MQCSYEVIIITETWLSSNKFDNELFDSRFIVHRRDRTDRHSKLDGATKASGSSME